MSHQHNHQVQNYNRAFALGIGLNLVFVVEAAYGYTANSLALISDAGHNLSDVLSLALAWGASYMARLPTMFKRTYGYKKITVMASLVSAVMLLFVLGGILWETIDRFSNLQPVNAITVIVVAGIGVFINTVTALLFMRGQKDDLNIKGAFLHLAADALVSLGVVVVGVVVMLTGWTMIDSLSSVVIVLIILFGTWGLLRDSFIPPRNFLFCLDLVGLTRLAVTKVFSNPEMSLKKWCVKPLT